jgi:DNA replication protein DnaC
MLPGIVPLCDVCAERQETEYEARMRSERWIANLRSNMPESYRNATPGQIPAALKPAYGWSQTKYPNGMGVVGESGIGKSCAVACLVAWLKYPFYWWSGTEARQIAIEAATGDSGITGPFAQWKSAMHRMPLLVIDDIAQAKFTESWASALYQLLEARSSNHLPTIWTMQITGSELLKKISDQNGGDHAQAKAIIRRMKTKMFHVVV